MSDAAPLDEGEDGPFAPTIVPDKPKRVRKSRAQLRAEKEAREGSSPAVPIGGDDAGAGGERRPAVGRRSTPRRTTGGSTRGRESIAEGAAFVYGNVLGQLFSMTNGPLAPAGRAMSFNAPVVGAAIDDLVAGTPIDKRLQPLAKRGDKVKVLVDAMGLPFIALVLGQRPEMYPVFRPMLAASLEANIVALGPQLVKKKKRDENVAKTMRELADEGMLPVDEMGNAPTIDDLVEMLFAPPPVAPPSPGDEPPAPPG